MASAHPLSVRGPRHSHRQRRPGAGLQKIFCKERASMKTRPGIQDDAARARAVTPSSPPFTARDRSGHLAAGRHPQARVPARQRARRTIIHWIIGRAERSGASAPPGPPGTRCAPVAVSHEQPVSTPRDGARRARAGPAPGRHHSNQPS
jgi:hypothetical protein